MGHIWGTVRRLSWCPESPAQGKLYLIPLVLDRCVEASRSDQAGLATPQQAWGSGGKAVRVSETGNPISLCGVGWQEEQG